MASSFSSEPVSAWLTLPDAANMLDVPVSTVRTMLRDRRLIGMSVQGVPAVPAELLRPEAEGEVIAPGLRGTVVLLADLGWTDAEIIDWLFRVDAGLSARPVDALWDGRKHAVRRAAQLAS